MPQRKVVTSDEEEAVSSGASSAEETKPSKGKQRAKRTITVKKPRIPSDDSEVDFVDHEEGSTKKRKKATKPSSPKKVAKTEVDEAEPGTLLIDESGNKYIELGKKRRATVSSFKGTVYLNIREFYDAGGGDFRPGKKGISLSTEQWTILKDNAETIDALFKKAKK
ncbi:transcriptional Coactivator p15-domain-containing protein [Irpex rosettiformis]|uniref:Transcriptional Coactivator p15-domain-containing protein n=1 Tax=Irpex rosettiformis TaxID=378272 RepID=A0ACB8UH35_9APHY|nr:transcriptional Coactivator p15-domain-containing protein [Irpex rosettiformis]